MVFMVVLNTDEVRLTCFFKSPLAPGCISDLGALLTSAVVMKQLFLYIPWALEDNCCGLYGRERPQRNTFSKL